MELLNVIKRGNMKQLQKYLVFALLAVPLVGFPGGSMTNLSSNQTRAVASPALKKVVRNFMVDSGHSTVMRRLMEVMLKLQSLMMEVWGVSVLKKKQHWKWLCRQL